MTACGRCYRLAICDKDKSRKVGGGPAGRQCDLSTQTESLLPASWPVRQTLRARRLRKSCCGHWRVCWRRVSGEETKSESAHVPRPDKARAGRRYGRAQLPDAQHSDFASSRARLRVMETHLGGGDARFGGMPLEELSLLAVRSLCATEASVDSAGSWMEAWLPWRCCGNEEATLEVDDGRDISWPMDGSEGLLSSVDAVLNEGRSNACRIDGLRNDSEACGRGRMEVASAEAVVY